jgi:hypothetical protein
MIFSLFWKLKQRRFAHLLIVRADFANSKVADTGLCRNCTFLTSGPPAKEDHEYFRQVWTQELANFSQEKSSPLNFKAIGRLHQHWKKVLVPTEISDLYTLFQFSQTKRTNQDKSRPINTKSRPITPKSENYNKTRINACDAFGSKEKRKAGSISKETKIPDNLKRDRNWSFKWESGESRLKLVFSIRQRCHS